MVLREIFIFLMSWDTIICVFKKKKRSKNVERWRQKTNKCPFTHTNNNTNNNYMVFRYLSNGLSVFFNMKKKNINKNKRSVHKIAAHTTNTIYISIYVDRTKYFVFFLFLQRAFLVHIYLIPFIGRVQTMRFLHCSPNLSFSASSYYFVLFFILCYFKYVYNVFFLLLFFGFHLLFAFNSLILC